MNPTAHEPTGVAAAIVVREGRVLMLRRRVSEGELSWQFPAGKIEAGETPLQAAVRETREEAGLDVAALRLLGERVHPKTGWRLSYVACAARTGAAYVAAPDEVAELAWVSHSEIPAYVPYGIFEPVQAYLNAALLG